MNHRHSAGRCSRVCFAANDILRIVTRFRADFFILCAALARTSLSVMGALLLQLLSIFLVLCSSGGAGVPANFGNAEEGLPALEDIGIAHWRWITEAGRGKGALGPAVVDACKMPVNLVRGRVAIELVAHVDQMLHRGNIHVVDGAEIQNDGFECRPVGVVFYGMTTAWSGVIPRSILITRQY